MSAAMTLARRGHHAVLFEKLDKLGGILYEAGSRPFKNDLLKFAEYLIHETEESGAEIRLNTVCDVETVEEEKPDVVIMATGSSYIRPEIGGIDNDHVFMAKEVDDGSRVLKCDKEGVHIDCSGEKKVLPADSIVIAFGTKSENRLYDEIYPLMPLRIYKIGDSDRGGANIMNAVQSGYDVAYEL